MKQTVEEAAYDYATNKTKFRKEVLKEVDPDNYVSRKSDCMEDFQCGAQWQAKQSPWISVEDRLPYDQDIVLVRDEYGRICTAYLHSENSGFITYGEDAYNFFGEITHWIPIPKFDE
jgi:hypothetical protein